MTFSTVHRCKGMEYDTIQIVKDFITEEKIEKLKAELKAEDISISKINEEINLHYVAITRTKNSIYIPQTLMPKDFPKSNQIHIIRVESKEEEIERMIAERTKTTNSKDKIREKHKGAYRLWTTELDDELTIMYCEGLNILDLSKHFERTQGAIQSRIKKLELEELYN